MQQHISRYIFYFGYLSGSIRIEVNRLGTKCDGECNFGQLYYFLYTICIFCHLVRNSKLLFYRHADNFVVRSRNVDHLINYLAQFGSVRLKWHVFMFASYICYFVCSNGRNIFGNYYFSAT